MHCDYAIYYILGLIGSFLSFYHTISEEKGNEEDKQSTNTLRKFFANAAPQISIMDRPVWYFLIKYFIVMPSLMGFFIFLLWSFSGQE